VEVGGVPGVEDDLGPRFLRGEGAGDDKACPQSEPLAHRQTPETGRCEPAEGRASETTRPNHTRTPAAANGRIGGRPWPGKSRGMCNAGGAGDAERGGPAVQSVRPA